MLTHYPDSLPDHARTSRDDAAKGVASMSDDAVATFDLPTVVRFAKVALDALGEAREEIDALNVYPVPDGDTGTNLFLTLESARDLMLERVEGDRRRQVPAPHGVLAADPAVRRRLLLVLAVACAEGEVRRVLVAGASRPHRIGHGVRAGPLNVGSGHSHLPT